MTFLYISYVIRYTFYAILNIMEQHPIPRQITTFEFKLIGFLTLHQFIYLVIAVPVGFLVYWLFPIPIVNAGLGLTVISIGLAFAFVPVNDRPLDVWIKNFINRLRSATQYVYHKENAPIYFLNKLFFVSDPHQVFAHIESQEKLSQYLASQAAKTPVAGVSQVAHKQAIGAILNQPVQPVQQIQTVLQGAPQPQSATVGSLPYQDSVKKPALVGVVRNNRKIPLPGLLIYIKDPAGKTVRLLKTNPHGIFATYSTLPAASYSFEVKDPKGSFVFDTMNMNITPESMEKPLEFYSKELL